MRKTGLESLPFLAVTSTGRVLRRTAVEEATTTVKNADPNTLTAAVRGYVQQPPSRDGERTNWGKLEEKFEKETAFEAYRDGCVPAIQSVSVQKVTDAGVQ